MKAKQATGWNESAWEECRDASQLAPQALDILTYSLQKWNAQGVSTAVFHSSKAAALNCELRAAGNVCNEVFKKLSVPPDTSVTFHLFLDTSASSPVLYFLCFPISQTIHAPNLFFEKRLHEVREPWTWQSWQQKKKASWMECRYTKRSEGGLQCDPQLKHWKLTVCWFCGFGVCPWNKKTQKHDLSRQWHEPSMAPKFEKTAFQKLLKSFLTLQTLLQIVKNSRTIGLSI